MAFLLAEVLLRIFPVKLTDYNTTFEYRTDPDLGYTPVPNQSATYNLDCVRNPQITTNTQGFRGPEWNSVPNDEYVPPITLLGDSYLLGLTVPDKNHIAWLLNSTTGRNIRNLGVSGFGTYHELLAWRKYCKGKGPEVVVLFVYLRNDVRDNHCGLSRPSGQNFSPCCEVANGGVKFGTEFAKQENSPGGIKSWIKRNCRTCRAWKNWRKPKTADADRKGNPFERETFAYQIYRPSAGDQWEEAWQITDTILHRLQAEVRAEGSQLLIVSVPDVLHLSDNWKDELAAELGGDYLPDDFDKDYPRKRFQAMADSLHLEVLHLEDAFKTYRDAFKLPEPEFGLCCDGHWNALGHQIASEVVNAKLQSLGWINSSTTTTLLNRPPQEIIGQSLYDKIFSCGLVEYE